LQKASNEDPGLRIKLESIISGNQVVLVAEEVNANQTVLTFGHELVGDDKWLSIDMNDQERKDHGIFEQIRIGAVPEWDPETREPRSVVPYYKAAETIRENFWLDRIQQWCNKRGISDGVVVITCGYRHLRFLSEKVIARGHTVSTGEYVPYDIEAVHGVFKVFD
jgi:hypothetical protein